MIYVMSDIHGQYPLYKQMLEKIQFSNNDTLYILGDMIDRGPESDKLLLDIINRPNVICLVGNHELMMYAHYIGDTYNDYWLDSNNGGRFTKSQLNKLSKEKKELIEDYLFNKTYLQVELELNGYTYLLSHSFFIRDKGTIQDFKPYYNHTEYFLNDALIVGWYSPWRSYEYKAKREYQDGRIHIIGHVPVQYARKDDNYVASWNMEEPPHKKTDLLYPLVCDNIINIDGGCARVGKEKENFGLICLNLTNLFTEKEWCYVLEPNTAEEEDSQ